MKVIRANHLNEEEKPVVNMNNIKIGQFLLLKNIQIPYLLGLMEKEYLV